MKTINKNLPQLTILALGIGLAITSQSSFARTWDYVGPYNSSTGVPNAMSNIGSALPSDLMNRIQTRLPESHPAKPALALLTDDVGANISLVKNATITVTFVDEGAGYTNAIGFFQVPRTELPTVSSVIDKIIFPNFSKTGSGGSLKYGDTVNIGTFTAGSVVGFTVVANGWQSGEVNRSQSASQIFRTIKRFNPEPQDALNRNAHTVLLSSPADGLLILGMEDLNRQTGNSDDDFNDAILAIRVDPFDAIDTGNMQQLSDGLHGTIPNSALSPDGKKVTICHFPPGNPENYQVIEISVNALNTHIDHHDDVFAVNGVCPAIPGSATGTTGDTSTGGDTGTGTGGSSGTSGGDTSTGGNSGTSGGDTGTGGSSGTSGGDTSTGGSSGTTSGGNGTNGGNTDTSGTGSGTVKGRLNWKEINKQ